MIRTSVLERNLLKQLEESITDVTPGVVVRAYQGGRMIADVAAGNTYPYYDLASLTKIIFTTQAMMMAFEDKKWSFESRVRETLSWFPDEETLIVDLLNHSSGMMWWSDLYKQIDLSKSIIQKRTQLQQLLAKSPLQHQEQSVYSDLGFMTLGFILEAFYDRPLTEVWNDVKDKFYLGTTLEFHENNVPKNKVSLYAPTEECPWRKKLVQGEVHDENTWALGGISTHAGLFGSIDDVAWASLTMRSQLMGIARYSIRQKTAMQFAHRSRPEGKGDWALGYMMPTPGSASCGAYFSLNSIGHTGFTGTSSWYDPKMDMNIIILSNRVLYGRDLKLFQQLRPQIHNWVVEGFRRSGV